MPRQLLEQENVAVVPGDVFGESGEGHIRCSYATSMEQIQEAMKRMKRFIRSSITKGMKKGQPIKGCPLKKGGNTRKSYNISLSRFSFFYSFNFKFFSLKFGVKVNPTYYNRKIIFDNI